jgi:dCTP deaminase
MSIRPDWWIREQANKGMIEPFTETLQREGVISYGLSSFGYDLRAAPEWRIFVNAFNTVVDPKNFDTRSLVEVNEDVCIIPPNSFVLTRSVEYLRIPDDTMVIALGKSSYARCFSADTRVALVDGTSPTLEEMAERHVSGEHFWGYSLGENGRLITSLLESPRFIGRDSLLEITLDDGAVIHATPDHDFMRRDGSWVAASELRPNDSLMPLYRDTFRGYEMTYQPVTGYYYPTHRLADEWNIRHALYDDEPGTHRHHVDHDRRNNSPWTDNEEARAAQGELSRRAWQASAPSRRHAQAERARKIRLHEHIDEKAVRKALDEAGSIWGAARLLGVDRSVFRRFPKVIAEHRGIPRNHKVASIRELKGDHDVYCLTVPEAGNFALEAGVFVSNCGIVANVTPLEPGWEGHVTLELSNTTPLPAKVYANEGIVQLLFFQGDRPETTYADRQGKYQGQTGVTLPKL